MHSSVLLPKKAVELAEGRSWGGRKVKVNIAHFRSNRGARGEHERFSEVWKANSQSFYLSEMLPTSGLSKPEKVRAVEGKMKG